MLCKCCWRPVTREDWHIHNALMAGKPYRNSKFMRPTSNWNELQICWPALGSQSDYQEVHCGHSGRDQGKFLNLIRRCNFAASSTWANCYSRWSYCNIGSMLVIALHVWYSLACISFLICIWGHSNDNAVKFFTIDWIWNCLAGGLEPEPDHNCSLWWYWLQEQDSAKSNRPSKQWCCWHWHLQQRHPQRQHPEQAWLVSSFD